MRALPAVLLLLTACHATNPAFCPDGEDPSGECIGTDPEQDCYGIDPFLICVAPPTAPRSLESIDTSSDCDEIVTLGRELCVVKGTDVEIAQRIRVSGARPLVVLASDALTIGENGYVDAAAAADVPGPGADLACGAGATPGGNSTNGGGGGSGGSFGSRGGGGGGGGGSSGQAGSAAAAVPRPSVLQGGCSGTDGGLGGGAGTRGARGRGGGAVYLVAGRTFTLHGMISAAGAGGRGGGASRAGGGGGGSGGMIVLYTPTAVVTASAQIFANGGGGGGGGGNFTPGQDGATPTSSLAPATGGAGQGDGGNGAFQTTAARAGQTSGDGGGGGGGGAGVIHILGGDFSAARISPPP